jgi:hypothetical protein
MIQIEVWDYQTLQKILSKHPYKFYAYGSRAKGTARKFSDLDLCYQQETPAPTIAEIRWEFTESNLPFLVELVAWKHMRPAFQQLIKKDLVLISPSALSQQIKIKLLM